MDHTCEECWTTFETLSAPPSNPHFLVLVGAVAVSFFLGIEAHRFREWKGHPELRSRAIGKWKEE